MTDRDTFAAAALTGLLADDGDRVDPAMPNFTARAYEWADAMLLERERERTNHDAVPEARATNDGGTPKDAGGTGNTQTAPPCVETDGPPSQGEGVNIPDSRTRLSEAEIDALEYVVEEGRIACMDDYGILRSLLVRVRPEWESQSYKESNEKRMNTTMNRDTTPSEGSVQGEGTETLGQRLVERLSITQEMLDDNEKLRAEIDQLREAIRRLADQDATLSVQDGNVTVTLDATLTAPPAAIQITAEEREAIEQAIDAARGGALAEPWTAATLRYLLKRLS